MYLNDDVFNFVLIVRSFGRKSAHVYNIKYSVWYGEFHEYTVFLTLFLFSSDEYISDVCPGDYLTTRIFHAAHQCQRQNKPRTLNSPKAPIQGLATQKLCIYIKYIDFEFAKFPYALLVLPPMSIWRAVSSWCLLQILLPVVTKAGKLI